MNMDKYDYIIVGSGFSGSVIARKIAEGIEYGEISSQKRILVIDRRNVISGNMYDEYDPNGILIQKYGPHIFHTDDEDIWNFIKPFASSWNYFSTGCSRVNINVGSNYDRVFPNFDSPFNFSAIDAFYDKETAKKLKAKLLFRFPNREFVRLEELMQITDTDIRCFCNDLYKHDVIPYTAKQWGVQPDKLDKSVLERIPVWLSYKWDGTGDKYQMLPQSGFYELFRKLLAHPLIDVMLNTDAMDFLSIDTERKQIFWNKNIISDEKKIFFTGKIDELLDYKFGVCGYRSLCFDYKEYNTESFQSVAIMIYPFAQGYTRITECKKLPVQNIKDKTIVALEYPQSVDNNDTEPYYPLLTSEHKERYERYRKEIGGIKNLYLLGRLADYKYYDMDQAIKRSLDVFELVKTGMQGDCL
jgi:UDP-galactopyranose mutase